MNPARKPSGPSRARPAMVAAALLIAALFMLVLGPPARREVLAPDDVSVAPTRPNLPASAFTPGLADKPASGTSRTGSAFVAGSRAAEESQPAHVLSPSLAPAPMVGTTGVENGRPPDAAHWDAPAAGRAEETIYDGLGQSARQMPEFRSKPSPPADSGWRQLPRAEAPRSDPDRPTTGELIEAGTRAAADPDAEDPARLLADLHEAFFTEQDPLVRHDLLATSVDLATEHGLDSTPVLELALQPDQPDDLRREALYLSSSHHPELLERISADPKHPLHTDAAAFLLEMRIEAGDIPPPVDEPPDP